jgi:tripartite-type tricarboxylate transporter receptor subunit TctC
VHTSAGGGTDLFARFTAELLTREKLVTQPVNVINRAGGGGAIAYTVQSSPGNGNRQASRTFSDA